MQAPIPQELSALMALEQGMRQGSVSPTTPQGTPTVAAQLAGAAQQQMMPQMPPQGQMMGQPGMMDMARQAGIAGQIAAMQQQQQQQQAQNPEAIAQMAAQMMQQRMQQQAQQQGPGGLESLNPNVRGFREGGIVGYNGEGESYVSDPGEMDAERILQMEQQAQERLAMQGAAPAASGVSTAPAAQEPITMEQAYGRGIEAIQRAKPKDISNEQILEALRSEDAATKQYLESQGIDVNFLRKAAEEVATRGKEQATYYEQQARAAQEAQQRNSLRDFLLGARGRTLGDTLGGGARAAIAAENAAQLRSDRFMALKFDIQNSAAKEQRLLEQARYQGAMGKFPEMRRSLQQAETLRQNREKQEADLYTRYGESLGRSERVERRAEAAEYAADVRRELGLARPGTSGREPIVRRIDEDREGNKIAIMSDGSQRPLGYKSAEYESRIGRMQQQLLKDGPPGYRKLTFDQQRQIAMEYVVGKSGTPSAAPPVAPPAATPGSAPAASGNLPPPPPGFNIDKR